MLLSDQEYKLLYKGARIVRSKKRVNKLLKRHEFVQWVDAINAWVWTSDKVSRAGFRWSATEDDVLTKWFNERVGVEVMAHNLRRTVSAILSRLMLRKLIYLSINPYNNQPYFWNNHQQHTIYYKLGKLTYSIRKQRVKVNG